MNKPTYAALALIAAVPGGFLSYMLVMTMLSNFKNMPGMFKLLVCAILACSALMTVMPIGIWIFVRDEEKEAEEAEAADDAEEADDVEAADEIEPMEEAPAATLADDVEITETDQVDVEQSKSVEFEVGDLPEPSDSVEFDADVYVTDEDEPPKKKGS